MLPSTQPLRRLLNRATRWCGVLIFSVLTASFIASRWWQFQLEDGKTLAAASIFGGTTFVSWDPANPPSLTAHLFLHVRRIDEPTTHLWMFGFDAREMGWPGRTKCAMIPLSWPMLLTAIPTTLAWRTHLRRARPTNLCPTCRYDLSGLPPHSPCPECGNNPR